MTQIPRTALWLGVAGLVPFVWGTVTLMSESAAGFGVAQFGPRYIGPYVQIFYGTVILSFMSGVLWGFAAKADEPVASLGYVLSVVPAIWAFFFVGGGPTSAIIYLIAGFLGLLGIDWLFWSRGLAPRWWLPLRAGLTGVVVLSLALSLL
ncbi:DUF3429 domain-containing protein [Actibacterium lipolyticum]|uniref:DUF3429 domain-containing protein n=1 Tax=Actibacterium lipolyticum TaxID=1524263 RepID=A0A238JJE8_9RHOB|nr:DUF3429 domain-containing protein [Actibacterium lipolyticum]SMX30808.1 hypothetical protein COL8621_00130 [Actibacterium lipolyticum]